MTLQVVARKKDGEWRSATVLDNVFQDAAVDESLPSVVGTALATKLSADFPEGSLITVTVLIEIPTEN